MPVLRKVLDTFAIMALFNGEPGADYIENLLFDASQGNVELIMASVNLGEVWYCIAHQASPELADHYTDELMTLSIKMIDADWPLTRAAAAIKVRGNISYADSFAAALAKIHGAILLTGDNEFKQLEDEISIEWLT
jgi:predicted nucleic acid-binding protein